MDERPIERVRRSGFRRRKIINYVQRPVFQLRYGLYFFLFGMTSSVLIQWLIYTSIRDGIADFYLRQRDGDILRWLDPGIMNIATEFLVFTLIYGSVCFLFGFYITHRVVGPLVPILRFIEQLKSGSVRQLRLRAKDDFKDLADKLNVLADAIEEERESMRRERAILDADLVGENERAEFDQLYEEASITEPLQEDLPVLEEIDEVIEDLDDLEDIEEAS